MPRLLIDQDTGEVIAEEGATLDSDLITRIGNTEHVGWAYETERDTPIGQPGYVGSNYPPYEPDYSMAEVQRITVPQPQEEEDTDEHEEMMISFFSTVLEHSSHAQWNVTLFTVGEKFPGELRDMGDHYIVSTTDDTRAFTETDVTEIRGDLVAGIEIYVDGLFTQ